MKKTHLLLAVLAIGLTACAGEVGPVGPIGPTGDKGSPGTSLLREYYGVIPEAGSYKLDVPEIKGKQISTYVLAFWSHPESPEYWTPMTDGWQDESQSHVFSISWFSGSVLFYQMSKGDRFTVKVFQYN